MKRERVLGTLSRLSYGAAFVALMATAVAMLWRAWHCPTCTQMQMVQGNADVLVTGLGMAVLAWAVGIVIEYWLEREPS